MTRIHDIIENIRTNGRDPAYRKSLILSALGHIMVLVVLPWMVHLGGCVDNVPLPDARKGELGRRVVKVRVMRDRPDKKIITNPNSPFIWPVPDPEDSEIYEQIERETLLPYTVDANAVHADGHPDGRDSGHGFPGGFADGKVRFIRLEYRGEDWDDGMDSREAADMNFLSAFRRLTDVARTARRGESHPIRYLAKYRKGQAPPFVYMTGSGRITGVSKRDIEILRDYLRAGGMLFADCGGPTWHRSFMAFARRLLPGSEFTDISDDDPIFGAPFRFPEGAPSFWHHGGFKARGIKLHGRWAVFYHPGDMNDAWKTGHSGLNGDLADAAHRLGVNVVWYACRNYMDATARYREKR